MPERWDPRKPKYQPRGPPQSGDGGKLRGKDRDKSRFAPKPKPVRPPIGEGVAILYGWHTVAAALNNPQRRINKIFATENAAHIRDVFQGGNGGRRSAILLNAAGAIAAGGHAKDLKEGFAIVDKALDVVDADFQA